ncbi:ABC transporter ATP-binding protein [Microbacterium sp. NPDC057650]|uniref:ABC transporter ATP-binding protein n=1 Tax=unclassified Microbacterium TaxID=2609290 RepID=UPI0036702D03
MVEYVVTSKGLEVSFPLPGASEDVPVLRGVSLSVSAGEMVAIVGPSGAGKSTLLYALASLLTSTRGSVSFQGQELGALSAGQLARLRRDKMGFIFQSYNLLPYLTALENVAVPLNLRHRRGAASTAAEVLSDIGLADHLHHLPTQLSGGQQQRVAIARVLACGPEVVFADEPTGALDTGAGDTVMTLLRRQTDLGGGCVLVTHDPDRASAADRVVVLRDGVVLQELEQPDRGAIADAMSGRPGGTKLTGNHSNDSEA